MKTNKQVNKVFDVYKIVENERSERKKHARLIEKDVCGFKDELAVTDNSCKCKVLYFSDVEMQTETNECTKIRQNTAIKSSLCCFLAIF